MSRTFDRWLIGAIIAGVIVLLALFACPAYPAVMHVADMRGGDYILLHDEAGPCVRGALRADYITAAGELVPGCWTDQGTHILVVFFDGDVGGIPKTALRRPTSI